MASVITGPLPLPSLLSSSSLSWRFGFISYQSLKGLSTSQVHTSPFEISRRVSKIQRHFSGKSKSSLLSGGGASGAFARRKTTCDLRWVGLTVARIARTLIGCAHEARIAAEFLKCRDCEILAARAAIQVPQRHQDHRRRSLAFPGNCAYGRSPIFEKAYALLQSPL